jgi:hypothetical protein
MALGDRLEEMLEGLPRGWEHARVDVHVDDPEQADRAATVLGPATPGRSGSAFRLDIGRETGLGGTSARLAHRVLERLDDEGIRARVSLVSHDEGPPRAEPADEEEEAAAAAAAALTRPAAELPLAEQWDRLASRLPPDWSDLLAEVRLDSTDHVDLGALLLGPVNPYLVDDASTFQFRVAHRFGYGAAPSMARRSLARLDEAGIGGRFRVLRVLSDTRPVHTQGPVWRIGGRAV